MIRLLLFLVLAAVAPGHADEAVWEAPFHEGGARPYRQKAPQERVTIVDDDSGQVFYRAELPAAGTMEGFSVRGPDLPGGRLARATAKVRGKGSVALMLYSANGWLYPPAVRLTSQWQEITASKTLQTGESDTLSLFFLSEPKQPVEPGAFVEVTAITVTLAPLRELPEDAIAPYAFALKPETISATRHLYASLPVPQTAHPFSLHVKAKVPPQTRLTLTTRLGGLPQTLRNIVLDHRSPWHTVPALSAEELGDEVDLALLFPAGQSTTAERYLWNDTTLSDPDAIPLE